MDRGYGVYFVLAALVLLASLFIYLAVSFPVFL